MSTKDKVLPLSSELGVGSSNDASLGWPWAWAQTQRDADWERVRPLVEALQILANPNSWATGGPKAIFVKVLAIAQVALAQLDIEEKP